MTGCAFDPFFGVHKKFTQAANGESSFGKLVDTSTVGETKLVLSCEHPDAIGCFDIYYTKMTSSDGSSVHQLLAQSGTSQKVLTGGWNLKASNLKSNEPPVWGYYIFKNSGGNLQLGISDDGSLAMQLASAVFRASDFAQPAISCLNVTNSDEPSKTATIGYFAASPEPPSIVFDEALLKQCEGLLT